MSRRRRRRHPGEQDQEADSVASARPDTSRRADGWRALETSPEAPAAGSDSTNRVERDFIQRLVCRAQKTSRRCVAGSTSNRRKSSPSGHEGAEVRVREQGIQILVGHAPAPAEGEISATIHSLRSVPDRRAAGPTEGHFGRTQFAGNGVRDGSICGLQYRAGGFQEDVIGWGVKPGPGCSARLGLRRGRVPRARRVALDEAGMSERLALGRDAQLVGALGHAERDKARTPPAAPRPRPRPRASQLE